MDPEPHTLALLSNKLISWIGTNPDAVEEQCDGCKKKFPLWEILVDKSGKRFFCLECRAGRIK
jgi:hypothetical protein